MWFQRKISDELGWFENQKRDHDPGFNPARDAKRRASSFANPSPACQHLELPSASAETLFEQQLYTSNTRMDRLC